MTRRHLIVTANAAESVNLRLARYHGRRDVQIETVPSVLMGHVEHRVDSVAMTAAALARPDAPFARDIATRMLRPGSTES